MLVFLLKPNVLLVVELALSSVAPPSLVHIALKVLWTGTFELQILLNGPKIPNNFVAADLNTMRCLVVGGRLGRRGAFGGVRVRMSLSSNIFGPTSLEHELQHDLCTEIFFVKHENYHTTIYGD